MRIPRLLALTAALLLGCSDPSDHAPVVRIVSGGSGTDTIEARVAQPIVVELYDRFGTLARDSLVVFSACCGGVLTTDTTIGYNSIIGVRTDQFGRARAFVQLSRTTGPSQVDIYPMYDGAPNDSVAASFQVRPGNLASIVIGVPDSAAYVGSGYSLRATAGDRHRNPRPDPLSFAAGSPVVTVDGTGRLSAQTIGRAAVEVSTAGLKDTAWITVPPGGVIAVFDQGNGFGPQGIVTVELDGSHYRMLRQMGSPYYGAWPSWSPSGELLFDDGAYEDERLYLADTLGAPPRLAVPNSQLFWERFGSISRDGSWFYFSGGNDLWRSRPDGSEAASLGVDSLFRNAHSRPSASPDGSRVVVLAGTAFGTLLDVVVLVPDSSAVHPLGVGQDAALPRWSPDNNRILYFRHSALWTIAPDGSGNTQVTPASVEYQIGQDWSPDNQWIITRRLDFLELLNLSTGLRLPLSYSTHFIQPSWRP